MNFNKRKGIAAATSVIVLVMFNIVAFFTPVKHTITFWIGYSFVTLAVILFMSVMIALFSSDSRDRMFRNLPIVNIAWLYFVLQIIAGVLQIASIMSYIGAIITDTILTGVFVIVVMASKAAIDNIAEKESYIADKVIFISNMKHEVSLIKTDDVDLQKKLYQLKEDIEFSDPMSHSKLRDIEIKIEYVISHLKNNIADKEKAIADIIEIDSLLKERNAKCRLLKNTKEPKISKDNSGIKYLTITVGTVGLLATIAIVICFVVIPKNLYADGMALYENEKYEEAKKIFVELDGFDNSKTMIELCNDEINAEKYQLALEKTEDRNYVDAINIYKELGDYKDSKEQIEKIHNRLAKEDVVYYGTYKENPIAWRIIETDNDSMYLIADEAINEMPYNEDLKNVDWTESSIYEWLNNEFIKAFSDEQLESIMPTKIDGTDCKIFLMGYREAEDLEDQSILDAEKEWWLRTKVDANAIYVSASGEIVDEGDQVVRAKGIRPCIWIDLK